MREERYQIKGMHCASCGTIITKKLSKMEGVDSSHVNYATEELSVSYDPQKVNPKVMDSEISKFGYNIVGVDEKETPKDDELSIIQSKVEFSFPVTIIFFVLMMWDISSNFISSVPKLPMPMQLKTL